LRVAITTKNVEVAGRRLSIEAGRVAEQAKSRHRSPGRQRRREHGDHVEGAQGGDRFLPSDLRLTRRLYAAGKIPGAFIAP